MKAVVLKDVGCQPTHHMITALSREDKNRVDHAERKISTKRRSSRQKQRLDRKTKKVEKTAYLSGGFGAFAEPELFSTKLNLNIKYIDETSAIRIKDKFLIFVE